MEYMLLRDGTVKAFDTLPVLGDVLDALADCDGVDYYWQMSDGGWCCINKYTQPNVDASINKSAVPEIVLLAQMME